ncbi:MAG: right-handed parallel beta-helix repeat-containing protein, partial [Ginsengibacter sp.]
MQKSYVRIWLFLFICLCSNTSLFSQAVIYVDSSATGLNNGQSWKNAYKNLDSALINAIDTNEDYTIMMAKGTYTPSLIPENLSTGNVRDVSFYITFSGTIVGGYSPGGGTLNRQLYPTILSGDIGIKNDSLDNAYHVLTLQYSDIEMSGITITGGNANGTGSLQVEGGNIPRYNGGGFYLLNGYADLHEIIAEHNTASYGGAIYNDTSEVDITNAVFDYNSSNRGGAIYNNSASTYTMNNIVAYRNFAENAGGAILNDNATEYTINNCTFVENFVNVNVGGAIYNTQNSATSTLTNCLFSGNYGDDDPSATTYYGSDIADSANAVNANFCVFQTDFHGGKNNYVLAGSGVADIKNPKGPDNIWMTKDDGLSITVASQAFKNGGNGTLDSDITGALRDQADNSFDIGAYEINKCGQLTGRIIYVDSSATGAQSGTSWANAFTDLQTAINLARFGCVDTIKVAAGTYHPSNYLLGTSGDATYTERFQLSSNVAILGGYPHGGSSVADPVANKTILSNKLKQVVFAGNVTNVLLSGLSIEDGNVQGTGVFNVNGVNYPSSDGGGIMVYNSGIEMRDCYINNNYASGNGGGMVAVNSTVKMERCSLEGNRAGTEGGGVYINTPSGAINMDSSVFTNNVTNYLFGGGIAIEDNSDSITISNSHFTGNQTLTAAGNVGGGGAIYSNSGAWINVTKCVFDSNLAFYGGALYLGNSSRSLVGNSFFLNNSASASGGAVDCRGREANFYNIVFAGNKAANKGGALYSESGAGVYFSTFIRNSAGSEGGATDGDLTFSNSITWLNSVAGDSLTSHVDPMFANINDIAGPDGIYGTGDDGLRLTLQSPFINQGGDPYDTSLIHTDITGAPRLQSIETDPGAYELDFCGLSDFVNKTIYVDSSAVTGNNTGRDWANAFTDLERAFK